MRLLLGPSAPLCCCGTRWQTLGLVLFYESIERLYVLLHFAKLIFPFRQSKLFLLGFDSSAVVDRLLYVHFDFVKQRT